MKWEVFLTASAKRQLKRFPNNIKERLLVVMTEMIGHPLGGDISKLLGEKDVWRRRVGDYRIKFRLIEEKSVVYVYEISRRTSSTY